MLNFFISPAFADTVAAPAAKQQDPLMGTIFMLVAFFVLIYFFMWRPQSKRAKEHQSLLTSLKAGDEVITSGGLLGKISKVEENFIALQLAENIEVKVQKPAITSVLPKGTLKF
jgi:preprotein translocase subunit YajC